MHYRKGLYNEFFKIFKENGFYLSVYTDESFSSINDNINSFSFKLIKEKYLFKNLIRIIKEEEPDIVVFFWNIYSITSWLLVFYLKIRKIPFVYWSQGQSMLDPDNIVKKVAYKIMHLFANAILLYSENERKIIASKLHPKVFVANNTINFNSIPTVELSKVALRQKYKIPFKKVVLFVGRIQKRKRLDILIDIFMKNYNPDYGLIIVGGGLENELLIKINDSKNILYFGELYENIDEIYKLSDVFCIPGTNGLGINHAMFWGLPVLTTNVRHNPEIYYLKNGINGFILNSATELEEKIIELFKNSSELIRLSENAAEIIRKEASVELMAKGFIDSFNYLNRIKAN